MSQSYYSTKAYNSQAIPQMPVQTNSIGGLHSFTRIPWGSTTTDAADANLFRNYPLKELRQFKGQPYSYSYIGDARFGVITHQVIREISGGRNAKVFTALHGIGMVLAPFFILAGLVGIIFSLIFNSHITFYGELETFIFGIKYFVLPLTTCYLIGYIAINYLPKLSRKPGLGSKWELNRQTGMVSLFTYDKKRPGEPIATQSVPFYECDAYLCNLIDRYGTTHVIVLGHRYSDFVAYVGNDLTGRASSPLASYCLWDFLQNYMDISKPLPDMPVLEQFRSLAPVTAAHDQQTGRDPHYFFKHEQQPMAKGQMETRRPPNNRYPKMPLSDGTERC